MSKKYSVRINDSTDITVGHFAMQGMRPTMEDSFTVQLDMNSQYDDPYSSTPVSLIGIFDGHCGSTVANHAGENFYKYITVQEGIYSDVKNEVCSALVQGFLDFDCSIQHLNSGCTACTCLFTNDAIYCANAGDSRAVLVKNNQQYALSVDHKPSLNSEKLRLRKAGGKVHPSSVGDQNIKIQVGPQRFWPGGLSVSRGLGDWEMKDLNKILQLKEQKNFDEQSTSIQRDSSLSIFERQLVTAVPDIHYIDLQQDEQALVIGCDGLFDVMTNQDIANFIIQNRPKYMIKALEQVIVKNIDQREITETYVEKDSFFKEFGNSIQKRLKKFQISLTGELGTHRLNEQLLLQADFLCAEILSQKLVKLAYQRESNDNISILVTLFRQMDTPVSINEWKLHLQQQGQGWLNKMTPKFLSKTTEASTSYSHDLQSNMINHWVSQLDPSKDYIEGDVVNCQAWCSSADTPAK